MSTCLHEIIANVKSFEDSLTSSSLLAKLLASSSKYKEAMGNCLSVLSNLGEEISPDVSFPVVQNELAVIQTTLATITLEQVKRLPPMTDQSKLNAMKFLSMLCMYSIISKVRLTVEHGFCDSSITSTTNNNIATLPSPSFQPMLLPVFSCRMVRLTIEHGFCDSSIVGLTTAGYGLVRYLQ